MSKIKSSKKDISINKYNEDNKLLYSFEVSGDNLETVSELNTGIRFYSAKEDKINQLTNYSEAVFMDFDSNDNFSNGIKIKVYVGDKYKLINEIKKYFPKNIDRFIEPFVGGGSVFMNVEANEYLLNDIDTNIIEIAMNNEKIYSAFPWPKLWSSSEGLLAIWLPINVIKLDNISPALLTASAIIAWLCVVKPMIAFIISKNILPIIPNILAVLTLLNLFIISPYY